MFPDWNKLKLAYYRHREKIWALYPKLSERIENYYYDLIISEGRTAETKKASRVLLIGAGATPYTAVTLAKKFGCCVTGIEKDPVAALLARQYLRRKAPGLSIKVKYGNGKNFKTDNFDIIAIALHARPKKNILECISHSPNRNLRVILRNPRGRYVKMYEEMTTDLSNLGFYIQSKIEHPEPYRFDTLILRKAALAKSPDLDLSK